MKLINIHSFMERLNKNVDSDFSCNLSMKPWCHLGFMERLHKNIESDFYAFFLWSLEQNQNFNVFYEISTCTLIHWIKFFNETESNLLIWMNHDYKFCLIYKYNMVLIRRLIYNNIISKPLRFKKYWSGYL